ncbi:MAG: chemotaxis protein CheC [Candidatus Heimdallarchaeota archaeon]|nr:chemotaxis protein CheC [Candidatus Heimdallarchaeota archaeon]
MTKYKFTEQELEAFKELGNVGAGHAAIALTKLLSKEVDMSIPFIRTGSVDEILKIIEMKKDDLVGFEISDVDTPIKYRLSVIFKKSVIISVLKLLTQTSKEDITKPDDLTEMQKSLLQEIGSTIILRYIAALNKMLKVDSMPEVAPILKIDKAKKAISEVGYGEANVELVLIQLDLFTDGQSFECQLFIQPHSDSIDDYRKAFFL